MIASSYNVQLHIKSSTNHLEELILYSYIILIHVATGSTQDLEMELKKSCSGDYGESEFTLSLSTTECIVQA